MLQSMRDNSQGIIAKVLVGLIIVVFALWGVDSLVGLATAEPPPLKLTVKPSLRTSSIVVSICNVDKF